MAEPIGTEVSFRVDQAIRDLQKLRAELGDTGDATEKMGGAADQAEGQWGNLSQQITAGVLVVRELVDAVSGAVEAIRDFGLEFERQAGILNRFSGDVSIATERTNGLFRSIDLMVAQQRALQAGLDLTAEEFATLSVAANESAAALGTDNVQALNRLVQAMATGRAGALREFGIDIRGITEASEIQTEVMGALSARYGDVQSSADTLGGQFIVLDNRIEEAKTAFFDVMASSNAAEESFKRLGETLAEVFGDGGGFNITELARTWGAIIEGVLTGLSTTIEQQMRGLGAFSDAVQALLSGEWSRAKDLFLMGVDAFAQSTGAGVRAGQAAFADAFGGGGGRGQLAAEGPGGGGGGGARRGRGRAGAPRGSASIFAPDVGGDLADEQGRLGAFGAGLVDEFGSMGDDDVFGAMAQQVAPLQKGLEDAEEAARGFGDSIADVASEMTTMSEVGSAIWQAMAEGPERALEVFLKSTAQRNTILALEELAKAAGSYPDVVGIEQHIQAALLHGAVAAAAGAGSAAMAGAGAARPAAPAQDAQGGGGGGTTVINYNSPVPEHMIGRQQERAARESGRRFAAVRS